MNGSSYPKHENYIIRRSPRLRAFFGTAGRITGLMLNQVIEPQLDGAPPGAAAFIPNRGYGDLNSHHGSGIH